MLWRENKAMNNTSQKNPIASHPLASWQENSSWEKDKRLVLKSSLHIVPTKPHRKQNLLVWLYPVTSVGQNWPLIYTSKVSLVYIKAAQFGIQSNMKWEKERDLTIHSSTCVFANRMSHHMHLSFFLLLSPSNCSEYWAPLCIKAINAYCHHDHLIIAH